MASIKDAVLLYSRVTPTRASNLDNLDATITTLVANSSGLINSLQYTSISLTATSTTATVGITSVSTAKTALVWLGYRRTGTETASNFVNMSGRITLTDSTTVTAHRFSAGGSSHDIQIGFLVMEFK